MKFENWSAGLLFLCVSGVALAQTSARPVMEAPAPRPSFTASECDSPAGRKAVKAAYEDGSLYGMDRLSNLTKYYDQLAEWKRAKILASGKITEDDLVNYLVAQTEEPAPSMESEAEKLLFSKISEFAKSKGARDEKAACAFMLGLVGQLPEVKDGEGDFMTGSAKRFSDLLDKKAADLGVSLDE